VAVKAKSGVSIARLMRLARPEWPRLALGSLFLLIAAASGLAWPALLRHIIDGTTLDRVDMIDRAAVFMAALFFVQGISIAMRHYLFVVAGEKVVTRLRDQVFGRILAQEIGFFDQRRTGELTSRLAADAQVLQNAVSINVSIFLRNFVGVVGGVALLAYTSPRLTVLMLLVVPPVALGAVRYGRVVRRLSREAQDAIAAAGEVAEESIANIRTVRAFTHEAAEEARYSEATDRSFGVARERTRNVALFTGLASFAGYGAVAVVLWYGGRLVIADQMTTGDLTSFVLYTLTVAFSLAALGDLYTDMLRALGASERIFELIDREPAIPATGGFEPSSCAGSVVFRDVAFSYPGRPDVPVIRSLSFAIPAGRRVALVGPSGGGKTTIASLLCRFYDPADGSIELDGINIRELDPSWLRARIAIVEQEPSLMSTSVAANIRYGRADASDVEVESAAIAANAHTFIEAFPEGYATQVGERGVQLSGGQKQRIAIARAILRDPRILVLDEATSALDSESESLVKDALDRLMRGRTTLIIAHRLSTVIDADEVLVIEHGQIVERGAHAELVERGGLYHRLVARQLTV
jgi:ABC transporter fused permease/ATP-binding protein